MQQGPLMKHIFVVIVFFYYTPNNAAFGFVNQAGRLSVRPQAPGLLQREQAKNLHDRWRSRSPANTIHGNAEKARYFSLNVLSTPPRSVEKAVEHEAKSLSTGTTTDENANPPDNMLFEPIGRGVLRDLRMRKNHWLSSDVTDGINSQCIAAVMFLFFACLAPAVGFGGVFESVTAGSMGTIEMISSTALCGMLYSAFAAQPMTIIGSTGPVLAFIACLAQFAKAYQLPFLPLYTWTGLWTSGILLSCALTSASNIVKYLTRFTDEIFSTLISAIFVAEAVSDVGGSFATLSFPQALLTLVTSATTFFLANKLKKARRSVFFSKQIRNTISNFGPTIGVVAATLLAVWAKTSHGTTLPGLSMPLSFGTTTGRPWLVPLFDLPVWARWASFFPAAMATVLLFLDQNITVRLVNNPKFGMKKGRREKNVIDGMHMDMLVLAALTAGQSMFGLPWLVAATVRSLAHVNALGKYDTNVPSVKNGGEPKRTGTLEQRVTGVTIHALIGLSVLLPAPRKLLGQVPLSVLMGLFMYLGVSSLPGNEMWERILNIFKNPKPQERWSTTVPRHVTNLFTFTQVLCLTAMFAVKENRAIGVFFPIVVAMLAPLRFGLERFGVIKRKHIEILDAE